MSGASTRRIALILAAGKGTRMKSDLAKVAHLMLDKPLVRWVVDAAREAGCTDIITIVGHGREQVEPLVDDTSIAFQPERLGTGHAVMCAQEYLEGQTGSVVVLSGDAPLIRPATIQALMDIQEQSQAAASVLTMHLDDPIGYGRVIRSEDGSICRIVEQKDCSPEEAACQECNSGFYCFDIPALLSTLGDLSNDNAQGEYYLTDCIGLLVQRGERVEALLAQDGTECLGVNSPEQLDTAAAVMRGRLQD